MTYINNIPEYANKYDYIVARVSEGEFWFWGAYKNELKAEEAAASVNGRVFYNNK